MFLAASTSLYQSLAPCSNRSEFSDPYRARTDNNLRIFSSPGVSSIAFDKSKVLCCVFGEPEITSIRVKVSCSGGRPTFDLSLGISSPLELCNQRAWASQNTNGHISSSI